LIKCAARRSKASAAHLVFAMRTAATSGSNTTRCEPPDSVVAPPNDIPGNSAATTDRSSHERSENATDHRPREMNPRRKEISTEPHRATESTDKIDIWSAMQISFAWQLVYERVYGQWPASLVFDNVVFIMNLTVCVHALLTPLNRFLSKTYSLEDMAENFGTESVDAVTRSATY
jgi:hypothetical protein